MSYAVPPAAVLIMFMTKAFCVIISAHGRSSRADLTAETVTMLSLYTVDLIWQHGAQSLKGGKFKLSVNDTHGK